LNRYLTSGYPLGEVPWSQIHHSDWSLFQTGVYKAISRIPAGETRTYAWVAERIGKPGARRAVGQALRNNPLPIIIPCHRVVGADSLGGFMGSKDPETKPLRLKQALLQIEDRYRQPLLPFLRLPMFCPI